MSLRIQKEHISSEDFANEIDNEDVVVANAVELSDNTISYRDDKGHYANIVTEEQSEVI